MPRHIKTAALAGTQDEADAKTRATVEGIIADVARRGDAAVRELPSASTNGRRRASGSRDDEIRGARRQGVAADDRRHQIRAGADPQFRRDPARRAEGCRGRDPAGRRARPPPHPGRQGRLLCAGRALSDGRLGAYVDRHRQGRRGRAHHRLHPAQPGRPAPRDDRGDASRRRRRDPCAGRRPGGGGDGARHRDASSRSTCWSAPATPMSPKPSASFTARSASICSPARPKSWSSPTTAPTPRCARPICWARPSTARPRRRSC